MTPGRGCCGGARSASLSLSTDEGPAFKPLPVAVCAVLSLLGPAAPVAWVLDRSGRGGGRGVGRVPRGRAHWPPRRVALTGAFIAYAASGVETGWTIAFALLALLAWRDGRVRAAIGWGFACALLRVEAWPFLLVAGAVAWRRRPRVAGPAGGVRVAVPALWFVPEWLGSGDLLALRCPGPRPEPRTARHGGRPCARGAARGLHAPAVAALDRRVLHTAATAAGAARRPRLGRARRPDGAGRLLGRAALLARGRGVRGRRGRGGPAGARTAACGLRGARHGRAARRGVAQARRPAATAPRPGLPTCTRRATCDA